MKPIGIKSGDYGCCPGHDKIVYKDQQETKRDNRDRKIRRKRRLTRYWKRSFKAKKINLDIYE